MCARDWFLYIGVGALAIYLVGGWLFSIFCCKPDPAKGWTYLPATRDRLLSSWKPPQYVVELEFIITINLPIGIVFLVLLHANREMMYATCHVF